tara:strand:+ start:430 stop:597 length:168 start_codon:yes stop_codon:yes gene_type:complete
MRNLILTLLAVALLLPFFPTEASENRKKVRVYNSAQMQELVITYRHLQSPLPWEK